MNNLTLAIGILMVFSSAPTLGDIEQSDAPKGHAGIINEHHGILKNEDTQRADEGSFPATPFNGKNSAYTYWQCFDKKFLHFKCSYQKPLDKQGSSFDIEIKTKTEWHFYSHAHAISGEICDEMRKNLTRILRGRRYFCINGTNDAVEETSGRKQYSWSFYRLKTKSGYVHYRLP